MRETVIRFAQKHMRRASARSRTELLPIDLFPKFAETGLMGVRYPVEDGSAGMDKGDRLHRAQEMSRVTPVDLQPRGRPRRISASGRCGAANGQKARWFAPALEGRKIAAFALSGRCGFRYARPERRRPRRFQAAGS